MLKKAKKKISKKDSSFQFQFNVTVKSAEFVVADKKWVPGKLVIEWKRNARAASTRGVSSDIKLTGPNVVSFQNEELSMLGTLHRDETEYDTKEYKFSLEDVREKKSKKTLGTAIVDLSKFATLTGESFERSFPLEIESTKVSSAKITLVISSRFIGQGKEDDEMSVMSAVSAQPEDKEPQSESDEENIPSKPIEKSSMAIEKKDDQVHELMEKIKSLERELSVAKQNGKEDMEKELEQLKTKMQIDVERHEIAVESLTRAKEDAEQELQELQEKSDKDRLRYERQAEVFREELKAAREGATETKAGHESESGNDTTGESGTDTSSELEAERLSWAKEKSSWRQEKNSWEQEKTQWEEQRLAWDQQRSDMEKKIALSSKVEAVKDDEKEEILRLQREKEELKTTVHDLEEEINSLRQEIEKTIEEKESLMKEQRELMNVQSDQEVALQDGSSKLEESMKREKKLQSRVDSLEEKCRTLESPTEGKDTALIESLEGRIAELENEVEQVTNSSNVKIKELQNLVSSFRVKSQDDGEKLSKEVAALKTENSELRERIEHLQQKQDEAPVNSRQTEERDGIEDLTDKEKIQEFERQARSANADLAELRKKYDRLSNMYKAQEEVIENLKQNSSNGVTNNYDESDGAEETRISNEKKLSEELDALTGELISAKMALAEGQFLYEKMRQSKKDASQQLAAEKLKTLDLRKKLTQFEVKYAGK